MKPISDRYSRIFSEYYYDKAAERFDYLLRYSNLFLEALSYRDKVYCNVNALNVDAFTTSYFLDVIKFKEYHFHIPAQLDENVDKEIHSEKLLNASKVGAFTAKWLLKYSPIVILPKPESTFDVFERRHIQNAPFILALNISLRSMGIQPHEVPTNIYKGILYHFRFRDIDDRSMILYFDLLVSHIDLLKSKK